MKQATPAVIDLRAFEITPEQLAANREAWKKVKIASGVYATVLLVLIGLSVYLPVLQFLVLLWFYSPVLLLIVWASKQKGKKHSVFEQRMKSFAADNNLVYSPYPTKTSAGIINNVGNDNHESQDEFRGDIYGYSYRLYWHKFSVGRGKSERPMNYAVMEINLPKRLPHIFLDSRSNNGFTGSEVLNIFQDKDRIHLEGDFSKYFNVYGVMGYAAEVLTILNPGFMADLIDHQSNFDIEFRDQTAFLYFPNRFVASKESIVDIYSAAEFIILALQKQLDTFTFIPASHKPPAIQKSSLRQFVKKFF